MKHRRLATTLIAVVLAAAACRKTPEPAETPAGPPSARGSVRGHVRVTGNVPANERIRMNADPMCARAYSGEPVQNEVVLATADGSLANVFVELTGDFPESPVPADPVTIDQRGCVYRPRVVGIRAGQKLQLRNSDGGLHNVHGVSTARDSFNIGQPVAGLVNTFQPRDPGMLQLKCDVHTWMVAFVGVVNHPYFAVTGGDGTFALRDVPEGTYSLRSWHERLGTKDTQVRIEGGKETPLEIVLESPSSP
jgi:plastocyanin